MSESKMIHHDIDHVERLVRRFYELTIDPARRVYVVEQIVETLISEQWLSELRCLRERTLSPCPDPLGHTHARD